MLHATTCFDKESEAKLESYAMKEVLAASTNPAVALSDVMNNDPKSTLV